MKKLFTSFVAAGTIGSFAACGKKDKKATTTKETKTETKKSTTATSSKTVVKGKVQKGTFKIGVVGEDVSEKAAKVKDELILKGKEIVDVVSAYTQDIKNPSTTGPDYFELPSGLFLKRSVDQWEKDDTDGKQLSDKTELASKNLDALFVQVKDGVQNKSDVYKTVVEKKEFKETKLFFVGKKAKSQEGASSKVFAGGHVSTASFNKYAAAYVGGFQAAVGAIKYSGSEDVYEETTVAFLIGSNSDSEHKKKAFAFRRGVEAAAAHPAYSKYLKVKFVSKTEDSSKSSKKLYREISAWKEKDDGKTKLYEFSSSEAFTDADRRVVYISGATARDWTGHHSKDNGFDNEVNKFKKADDLGLIGALFNYEDIDNDEAKTAKELRQKTFSRGVYLILDKATPGVENDDNANKNDNDALKRVDYAGGGIITLERDEQHNIKFYGAIGGEAKGTELYVKNALKGLYMGGANYMIGKHVIFGAQLDLSLVTSSKGNDKDGKKLKNLPNTNKVDVFAYGSESKSVWASTNGKDSPGKSKERFKKSLGYATSLEVTEAELTKSSPWLK